MSMLCERRSALRRYVHLNKQPLHERLPHVNGAVNVFDASSAKISGLSIPIDSKVELDNRIHSQFAMFEVLRRVGLEITPELRRFGEAYKARFEGAKELFLGNIRVPRTT